MSDLRSNMLRIASELPQGDSTRREILEVLASKHQDRRYVDSDDPRAKLVAWGGPQGTMDMGGWTDRDAEAFLEAIQDEALFGAGRRLDDVEILDARSGRKVLAADKRAGRAGLDILNELLDRRAFTKVWMGLRRTDPQSAELLREVFTHLADALDISDNEQRALQRLRGIVGNPGWDPSLQRNNIFKAADLLGIKLPSGMF